MHPIALIGIVALIIAVERAYALLLKTKFDKAQILSDVVHFGVLCKNLAVELGRFFKVLKAVKYQGEVSFCRRMVWGLSECRPDRCGQFLLFVAVAVVSCELTL